MSTTALSYYEAARNEIIYRLRLRDQVLLAYTVASGSIIGVTLTNLSSIASTVALIVPFFALGSAILIASHSIAITNLGHYTIQLKDSINECRESDVEIEPWDYSRTYVAYSKKHSRDRLRGHIFIINIPSIFSLFVAYEKFNWAFMFPQDVHSLLWYVSVLLIIYSIWVLLKAHFERVDEVEGRIKDYGTEH